MRTSGLGRRVSPDDRHVQKYPLRALGIPVVPSVNRRLDLNSDWRLFYDQGHEGACVGFSLSMLMTILNREKYDARWLYRSAQALDEWADTPPQEGTSVRAGCDVLLAGHRRVRANVTQPVEFAKGIAAYRWARSVDEIRTLIYNGTPAVAGMDWHYQYDRPEPVRTWRNLRRSEYWIGRSDPGRVVGGHAICITAARDDIDAFGFTNTWGEYYPTIVYMHYRDFERRVLSTNGEVCVITDR